MCIIYSFPWTCPGWLVSGCSSNFTFYSICTIPTSSWWHSFGDILVRFAYCSDRRSGHLQFNFPGGAAAGVWVVDRKMGFVCSIPSSVSHTHTHYGERPTWKGRLFNFDKARFFAGCTSTTSLLPTTTDRPARRLAYNRWMPLTSSSSARLEMRRHIWPRVLESKDMNVGARAESFVCDDGRGRTWWRIWRRATLFIHSWSAGVDVKALLALKVKYLDLNNNKYMQITRRRSLFGRVSRRVERFVCVWFELTVMWGLPEGYFGYVSDLNIFWGKPLVFKTNVFHQQIQNYRFKF